MTKVILITNKSDVTCDFIVRRLTELNIDFYRFNTDELTKSVNVSLNFSSDEFWLFDSYLKERIDLSSFTAVYFRRPELPSISYLNLSEGEQTFLNSEILYTLEGIYKILDKAFWVSPLYSIRQAENKPYQLITAKKIGFQIPKSLISNSPKEFNAFLAGGGKVIKPIKSGFIEESGEEKIIFTSLINEVKVDESSIASCPQFLQEHVLKEADVRVTVVGKKVFAALIDSQKLLETAVDWRRGENSLTHEILQLPEQTSAMCIELVEMLGLNYGAIDLILTGNNNFIFLEINPNGQWAWIETQTGLPISNEIVNLLIHEKH